MLLYHVEQWAERTIIKLYEQMTIDARSLIFELDKIFLPFLVCTPVSSEVNFFFLALCLYNRNI